MTGTLPNVRVSIASDNRSTTHSLIIIAHICEGEPEQEAIVTSVNLLLWFFLQ